MRPMLFVSVLLVATAPLSFGEDAPTLRQVRSWMRLEKWDKAEAALRKIVKAAPNDGVAWAELANTYQAQGKYQQAIEANTRASEQWSVRRTALYNIACSWSLLEDRERAREALAVAMRAGYMDFDFMQEDPDLQFLRDHGDIDWPETFSYEENRGRNGVRIPYHLQLPEDYDPEESYEAFLCFSPGSGGKRCTDWAIENLWGSPSEWIVLSVVAPKRGWINHPAHHALEDLLKKIRKDHSIDSNRFHFLGFGEGSRPATTYSGMSRKYCRSLTVASSHAWAGWDDGEISRFNVPVVMLVGSQDPYGMHLAKKAKRLIAKGRGTSHLEVFTGESVSFSELWDGELPFRAMEFLDLLASSK